ncbi:MAG: PDZ domain-containing protein [Verrucomicrobia bacterium]|nr:PDZ domain-containing protein [Verrucomicrobiota bacterium]
MSLVSAAVISQAEEGKLSADQLKRGDATLRAFAPLSKLTRQSVVKIDLNGNTVALGAVVDANGLAVTKASEIKPGKLSCWLASGKEVPAELLAVDEENDVALLKVNARGLVPIQWSTDEVTVGQWVVTPGIAETPQAIGIVSVHPRKILHPKAFIGVQLDFQASDARIARVMAGLGAEAAGLKPGDRILAVNDWPVKQSDELMKTLRQFREGQSVKLRVRREQEEFDASVNLMAPKSEGGGRESDREDRMSRMGSKLSGRAQGFELAIQHDTVLQNWQCGGPLLNLEGKAIGLNIARADRVASFALPADFVRRSLQRLQTKARPQQPQAENTSTKKQSPTSTH